MAYMYTDPTSIDFVLQRAHDELRRGEGQHYRSTEAQYTNHVKELLGNLERYLETCGVELPPETLSGVNETSAALAEAGGAPRGADTLSANAQIRASFVGAQRVFKTASGRSASASAAHDAEHVYRESIYGASASAGGTSSHDNASLRVGWGNLATPTEVQHLGARADGKPGEQAAAARRVKSDTATTALQSSLGSNAVTSPVLAAPGRGLPRVTAASAAARDSSRNASLEGWTSTLNDSQHQQKRQPVACATSPHSPAVAVSDKKLAMSPAGTTPFVEGGSFSMISGSAPLVDIMGSVQGATIGSPGRSGQGEGSDAFQSQQQQPSAKPSLTVVRSVDDGGASASTRAAAYGSGATHNASNRVIASEALTVTVPAISSGFTAGAAAAAANHASSGHDPWGEFGQFVQSITESRPNSNVNSIQSGAAALYPMPAGCAPSTGVVHHAAAPSRSHDNAAQAFTVAVPPSSHVPESGFQLPHVLATVTAPTSPHSGELPPQQQQQSPFHSRVPSPPTISPHISSVPVTCTSSAVAPGSVPIGSSQAQRASAVGLTSISSHSPSIPLQAAFGAGSNAVRALATAAESDKEEPEEDLLEEYYIPRSSSPLSPPLGDDGDAEKRGCNATTQVEHIPTPPQLPRSNGMSAGSAAAAPMQRAASLPVAGYVPYGHGGSPFYPHILRVSTPMTPTHPRTQMNTPTQPVSVKASPLVVPRDAQNGEPDSNAGSGGPLRPQAADETARLRTLEKEQLMRRLRGILDKSASTSASPSVVASYTGTDDSPLIRATAVREAWATKEAPSPASVMASTPQQMCGLLHLTGVSPPEAALWCGSSDAPSSTARSGSPASPVQTQHPPLANGPPSPRASETNDSPGNSTGARSSTAASERASGTVANATNAKAWGLLRFPAPTKHSAQLDTPSNNETGGSLPTGLFSASRRTLLSNDVSVGGSNGPRPPHLSKHHHHHAPRRSSSSAVQGDTYSIGIDAGSCTTVDSTTAPTYGVDTLAPSFISSAARVSATTQRPHPTTLDGGYPTTATVRASAFPAATVVICPTIAATSGSNGFAPGLAKIGSDAYSRVDDNVDKQSVSGNRMRRGRGDDDGDSALSETGMPHGGQKQQLMERLRIVLNRSDD